MKQMNAYTMLRADFLAIHRYGWTPAAATPKPRSSRIKWAEGFAGDRPIWITRVGCLNQSAPDAATVVTFYKAASIRASSATRGIRGRPLRPQRQHGRPHRARQGVRRRARVSLKVSA
jgi:hypothetical protein